MRKPRITESTGRQHQRHTTVYHLASTFAENLQRERERRGWGRKQLAKRAEIGVRTVQTIEELTYTPTLSTVEKLCRALRVDPAAMLFIREDRKAAIRVARRMRPLLEWKPEGVQCVLCGTATEGRLPDLDRAGWRWFKGRFPARMEVCPTCVQNRNPECEALLERSRTG